MRRRRAIAGLAASALIASAGLHMPVAGAESDRSASLKFRAEFGLSVDIGLIDALLGDRTIARDRWGIPLTAGEEAEMQRRQRISDSLDLLLPKLDRMPDYGGVWVDQRAGGVVDVAFVTDPERHRAEILEDLPPNTQLRLREVSNSWQQLVDIQHQIREDVTGLQAAGFPVFSVSPNPIANRVEVGTSHVDESAIQAFASRYGPNRTTLFRSGPAALTSCTSRSNCPGPPFQGGLKVTGPSYACSNAFFVTQSGFVRWMTAGHCAPVGAVYAHPGLPSGMSTVRTNSYYSTTQADAATVGNVGDIYNNDLVYRTSTTSWDIDTNDTGYAVGDPVCLSGWRADATRCGTILATSIDVCINCPPAFWLYDQVKVSYTWLFGDSGGAAHSGSLAMGVQSGCIDQSGDGKCTENTVDKAFYSNILFAFNRLGGGMAIYNEGCVPPAC